MSLKENLCGALELIGIDAGTYQFDDHSIISLSFRDVGDIYLDPQPSGQVWMWGLLEEMSEQTRAALAASLLAELTCPADYWAAGATTLRTDGRVGGLLADAHATQPELLAQALLAFHQSLARLQAVK